jgi:hypothetical protein
VTDQNPGLSETQLDTVMYDLACSFEQLWRRPNAARYLEQWQAGKLVFEVTRDGITVVVLTEPAGQN